MKSGGTADYEAVGTTAVERRSGAAAGAIVDHRPRTRASSVLPAGMAQATAAAGAWPPNPAVLVGEREHRLYILTPENLEYVEAEGNYVRLHGSGLDYISRDSIKRLASVLAVRGFVRIERSLLINIRAIAYLQRKGRGRYRFTLLSGASLESGPSYRAEILRAMPLSPAVRHAR